jgi:hypothetical protein
MGFNLFDLIFRDQQLFFIKKTRTPIDSGRAGLMIRS